MRACAPSHSLLVVLFCPRYAYKWVIGAGAVIVWCPSYTYLLLMRPKGSNLIGYRRRNEQFIADVMTSKRETKRTRRRSSSEEHRQVASNGTTSAVRAITWGFWSCMRTDTCFDTFDLFLLFFAFDDHKYADSVKAPCGSQLAISALHFCDTN